MSRAYLYSWVRGVTMHFWKRMFWLMQCIYFILFFLKSWGLTFFEKKKRKRKKERKKDVYDVFEKNFTRECMYFLEKGFFFLWQKSFSFIFFLFFYESKCTYMRIYICISIYMYVYRYMSVYIGVYTFFEKGLFFSKNWVLLLWKQVYIHADIHLYINIRVCIRIYECIYGCKYIFWKMFIFFIIFF